MKEYYDGQSDIYGVYYDYEDGNDGLYDIFIGAKAPRSDEALEIRSGKYAVFSFPNELQNVAKFWSKIWSFFEAGELKRAFGTDFEFYGGDEIKIFISVL